MIWFISDTHFGHKNVIQYCNRPFQDVNQMDECLMDNWNSRVQNGDTVYHLGDVSFMTYGRTREILNRLNGRKFLIRGNHDGDGLYQYFNNETDEESHIMEIFYILDRSWWVSAHERENETGHLLPIVLCHYPMLEWNQSHRGSWQLHGHSHGKLEPNPRRQYDVGVDNNNYAPVSLDELMVIMRNRGVTKHHDR